MKHTKRMYMVPDDEYAALMNLFTGGDALKVEKVQTESKMAKILRNPQLTQLEKGKKTDLLYKKRRQLDKMISERPQKVQNMPSTVQEILPTTGVVPAVMPQNNLQEMQHQEEQQPNEHVPEEVAQIPELQPPPKPTLSDFRNILPNEDADDLVEYLERNRQRFGINARGGILKNKRYNWEEPISDLAFTDIVDYLSGVREDFDDRSQRQAAGIMIKRLLKDDVVRRLFALPEQQHGEGRRRYIIEVKTKKSINKKTPGLPRVKFKPVIWTRIGV